MVDLKSIRKVAQEDVGKVYRRTRKMTETGRHYMHMDSVGYVEEHGVGLKTKSRAWAG